MRFPILLSAVLTAATLYAQAPGRQKRTVSDAEVAKVHKSAILIDTHNDFTSATLEDLDIGTCPTPSITPTCRA